MEKINPNDIAKLDMDNISLITLKNGNTLMVDEEAPEKYSRKNSETNNKILFNSQNRNKLKVSKINAISFEEKGNKNNLNFEDIYSRNHNSNRQRLFQNNFNLISSVSRNINFTFRPTINSNSINSLSNFPFNKEMKKEEINKEEKDLKTKSKSRNYFTGMNSLFNVKPQQKDNNTISLNILSDKNKYLNSTQKEFNSLLTQLKLKKNKFSMNAKDKSTYQRYYELYKGNENNIIKQFKKNNCNKIKYYTKPESEKNDKIKDYDVLDKNKFNKNINDLRSNSNNFYLTTNESDINSRTSINSFCGNKSRASSESRIMNYKLGGGNIGYSSTLICPSNIFKSKLNTRF